VARLSDKAGAGNVGSVRGSRLLLPVRWIAAAVKAGDDGQRSVGLDNKLQSEGKVAEEGAADGFVDDRKLPGISAHGLDYRFNRRPETSAQAGNLVLVPILRIDQLGAGGPSENNRIRYGQRCSSSAFKAAQVIPPRRSWSSVARRLSSSACCVAVRGRWLSSKLSQSCEISARRSGGVRRTSSSWESNSMHRA
jgi:hypothetical protein